MEATVNVKAALVTSLNARRGVSAGTTWGEFQAAMRDLGVRDRDTLSSIEYGVAAKGSGLIVRDDDDDGGNFDSTARGIGDPMQLETKNRLSD